jgi:hypothetical protein
MDQCLIQPYLTNNENDLEALKLIVAVAGKFTNKCPSEIHG